MFIITNIIAVSSPPHNLFTSLLQTLLCVLGAYWYRNRWHEHPGSGVIRHGVWRGAEEAGRWRGGTHSFLQCVQRGHHGAGVLDHVVSRIGCIWDFKEVLIAYIIFCDNIPVHLFPSAFSSSVNCYLLSLSGISLLASCSWWAVRLWRWKMWFFWLLVWENTSLLRSWATLSTEASSCPSSTSVSHARTPSVSCQASSRPSPLPSPPAPGILSRHRILNKLLTVLGFYLFLAFTFGFTLDTLFSRSSIRWKFHLGIKKKRWA